MGKIPGIIFYIYFKGHSAIVERGLFLCLLHYLVGPYPITMLETVFDCLFSFLELILICDHVCILLSIIVIANLQTVKQNLQ